MEGTKLALDAQKEVFKALPHETAWGELREKLLHNNEVHELSARMQKAAASGAAIRAQITSCCDRHPSPSSSLAYARMTRRSDASENWKLPMKVIRELRRRRGRKG